MALLPDQILPQSVPWGRLNENGDMIIDANWWLFLVNLAKQVLSPGTSSVTVSSAALLLSSAIDAQGTDTAGIQREIANVQTLIPPPYPAAPLPVNFPPLLQDAIPQAQPVAAVTVGSSPFVYTAPFDGALAVVGAVTAVALVRQGTSVPLQLATTGLLPGMLPIRRLDQVSITYAVLPTITFAPS